MQQDKLLKNYLSLMNKQLTFIFVLSFIFYFSGSSYCEEPVVKRKYWRNGNLKSETHYKDGEIEGLETWFYRTGDKLEETYWKNGRQSGLVFSWNKNGRKKYETNWMNGKLEGLGKW